MIYLSEMHIKLWACLCSKTRSAAAYLFVSQCSRRFEWGCGAEAAEGPGLADLWRLQGPTTDRAEAAQVRQMSRCPDHAQWLAFHGLHAKVNQGPESVGESCVQQVFHIFTFAHFCLYVCVCAITLEIVPIGLPPFVKG